MTLSTMKIIDFYAGIFVINYTLIPYFKAHKFDAVINLAAESHVDQSIKDPLGLQLIF